MNIEYFEIKKLPVVVIDNFYNDDELSLIMNEIHFLHNTNHKFKLPEDLASAYDMVDGKKVYKKNNVGIVLEEVYLDRNVSNILTLNRKLFSEEFLEKLISLHEFFVYLKISTYDITKLHYYANEANYNMHHDDSVISATSWFYNLPKKFNGGDLVFENGVKVDCKHNRLIIFSSILKHSVEKVILDVENENQKNGRYSINQFIQVR